MRSVILFVERDGYLVGTSQKRLAKKVEDENYSEPLIFKRLYWAS